MESRRSSSTTSAERLGKDANTLCSPADPGNGLVGLFLARCAPAASPFDAMDRCVERLRAAADSSTKGTLDPYFEARGVQRRVLVAGLDSDGAIKPLGSGYLDGFTVEINAGLSGVRRRFTEAHELCHTFFYELVPEIKFRPHERDPLEESLCNYGASVLLIPDQALRQQAGNRSRSLATLEALSQEYGVALETMFLRLRQLGLWDGHLSIWHRSTLGRFFAQQLYGLRAEGEWSWVGDEVLDEAWEATTKRESLIGRTLVYREDRAGRVFAKAIYYELRRRGNVLVVLSNNRTFGRGQPNLPLFGPRSITRKRRASHRARGNTALS